MKKIIIYTLILLMVAGIVFVNFTPEASSKTRAYYSGEAISYNGKLYIGSTNMNSFELFILEGDELVRTVKLRHGLNFRPRTENFFDLEFSIENNRLYTYLSDGRFLFKYDVSDPYQPVLVNKILDNSNKWFSGLQMTDNNLASISNKGVNIWNNYLQVVDNFAVESKDYKEVSLSPNGKYIFRIHEGLVDIFSTAQRAYMNSFPFVSYEDNYHAIYNDEARNEIYICDDASLKVYDLSGNLQRTFTHTSDRGYDVDAPSGADYVYFSDGIGIVKLNKQDMKPLDWVYTTSLGEIGGWAMGLKAVHTSSGDKVVVFNNSSILVLDQNLDLIDSFRATEPEVDTPAEDLWMTVDKNRAPRGSAVSVRGGGFLPYEELTIVLTNRRNYQPRATYAARANYQGRFTAIITIPTDTSSGYADIRVRNDDNDRSWSMNFTIE